MIDVAVVPASIVGSKAQSRPPGRALRYRYRLVLSILVLCIPLLVALAVILTTKSSASLTREAEHGGEEAARAVTLRVQDWIAERHQDLAVVTRQLDGIPDPVDKKAILDQLQLSGDDYQLQAGLILLERVTDAAGHVRLTTQQQRSATGQVVETMEQLTDASRQVSATAQQIAAAAGTLADLAGNLEATAATTRERY